MQRCASAGKTVKGPGSIFHDASHQRIRGLEIKLANATSKAQSRENRLSTTKILNEAKESEIYDFLVQWYKDLVFEEDPPTNSVEIAARIRSCYQTRNTRRVSASRASQRLSLESVSLQNGGTDDANKKGSSDSNSFGSPRHSSSIMVERVADLEDEICRLENELEEMANQAESAATTVEQVTQENRDLQEKLRLLEDDATALNTWNIENIRQLQEQDEMLHRATELEELSRGMAAREKAKTEARLKKLWQAETMQYEKQLSLAANMGSELRATKEELRLRKQECESLRKTACHTRTNEYITRIQRMRAALQKKQQETQKKENMLARKQLQLNRAQEENKELGNKYDKLRETLQRHASEHETRVLQPKNEEILASTTVKVLRKKLADKEHEVTHLNHRLRKSCIAEHKFDIQKREFTAERARYEAEFDNWRRKLNCAEKKIESLGKKVQSAELHQYMNRSSSGAIPTTSTRSTNGLLTSPSCMTMKSDVSAPPRARPQSAYNDRSMPIRQRGIETHGFISVVDLLPKSKRPQSAPKCRT